MVITDQWNVFWSLRERNNYYVGSTQQSVVRIICCKKNRLDTSYLLSSFDRNKNVRQTYRVHSPPDTGETLRVHSHVLILYYTIVLPYIFTCAVFYQRTVLLLLHHNMAIIIIFSYKYCSTTVPRRLRSMGVLLLRIYVIRVYGIRIPMPTRLHIVCQMLCYIIILQITMHFYTYSLQAIHFNMRLNYTSKNVLIHLIVVVFYILLQHNDFITLTI